MLAEHEREREQRRRRRGRRASPGSRDAAHSAPRSRAPKRPCGRTNSTAISTTKNAKRRPGRRDLDREDRLADAHEQRRDDRAAEAAEPAEDDDREQPRDQVVVAAGVEREDDPVDRAGRGRRRHAEAEADRRHPLRRRRRAAAPTSGSGPSRGSPGRTACARASEQEREQDRARRRSANSAPPRRGSRDHPRVVRVRGSVERYVSCRRR